MVNISKEKCKYFTGMVFVTFFTKEEATSFLGLPSVEFHKIPIKRDISMKSTKKEEQQEVLKVNTNQNSSLNKFLFYFSTGVFLCVETVLSGFS